MAQKEEPKVLELRDKGECYTAFKMVKMEDATNVFYEQQEGRNMFLPRCQVYSYTGINNHHGQECHGFWEISDYDDDGNYVLFLDIDMLLSKVAKALTDPKVKVVPYSLPFGSYQLMFLNRTTNDLGFGYSTAKMGFVRKQAKKEKKVVGKAPILELQKAVAAHLDRYIRTEADFVTVKLSTTASKREIHNAVVLLKRFGMKLEDCFWEHFQTRVDQPGGDWTYESRYEKRTIDWRIDQLRDNHKLSAVHKKQLKDTIIKWWDECLEMER